MTRRELGVVTLGGEPPSRTPDEQALADRALTLLREEVARLAALRAEYAVERARGAPSGPPDDGAARLEGACRFALRMGLVSPVEAREVFHEAAQAGLHERGGSE
jgi:hypothetical protein